MRNGFHLDEAIGKSVRLSLMADIVAKVILHC